MKNEHRLSELRQIAITVSDVGTALPFYRDVLGLPFLFSPAPTLAFLEAGSVRIMLTTPQGAGTPGQNSILYFKVTDIVATHTAIVGRGAKNERAPQLQPECRTTSCGRPLYAIPMETWSVSWRRSVEAPEPITFHGLTL